MRWLSWPRPPWQPWGLPRRLAVLGPHLGRHRALPHSTQRSGHPLREGPEARAVLAVGTGRAAVGTSASWGVTPRCTTHVCSPGRSSSPDSGPAAPVGAPLPSGSVPLSRGAGEQGGADHHQPPWPSCSHAQGLGQEEKVPRGQGCVQPSTLPAGPLAKAGAAGGRWGRPSPAGAVKGRGGRAGPPPQSPRQLASLLSRLRWGGAC